MAIEAEEEEAREKLALLYQDEVVGRKMDRVAELLDDHWPPV